MQIAIGHSIDPLSSAAAEELMEEVAPKCRRDPDIGLLFVSSGIDPEPIIRRVRERWPDVELIGCSTDGELSCIAGFEENSSELVLLQSDRVAFHTGVCRSFSDDPDASAQEGYEAAMDGVEDDPSLCLIFPESLTTGGDAILRALQARLGRGCSVFGGLAADQWDFHSTLQFYGDEILTDAAPFVMITGPIEFAHGNASGWTPMGQHGWITRAEGNIIYRIDDGSAFDFYNYYIGNREVSFGEHPLQIETDDGPVLRAPLQWSPQEGWIRFAGDVHQGRRARITTVVRDDIDQAVTESATDCARFSTPLKSPDLVLIFSCAARRYILGTRTCIEYQRISHVLSQGPGIVGGYFYGEIAPGKEHDRGSVVYNEAIIALCLRDGG